MPWLGVPGPWTPLPTLPSHIPIFGPKYQHKEKRGSQRKGRAEPGSREGMRTFPVQVAAGCSGRKSHVSVNCRGWWPVPLWGPALTPAHGHPAALWLPLALAQASSLEGWAGWARAGAGRGSTSDPDVAWLCPPWREAQQTSYTKAKSTVGKPRSHFTGRETEATGTSVHSPWEVHSRGQSSWGSTCLGRGVQALGLPVGLWHPLEHPMKKRYCSLDSQPAAPALAPAQTWAHAAGSGPARGTRGGWGVRLVVSPKRGRQGLRDVHRRLGSSPSGRAPGMLYLSRMEMEPRREGRGCQWSPQPAAPACPRDDKCGQCKE